MSVFIFFFSARSKPTHIPSDWRALDCFHLPTLNSNSPLCTKTMAVPGFEPGSSGSQPLMLTTTLYDHCESIGPVFDNQGTFSSPYTHSHKESRVRFSHHPYLFAGQQQQIQTKNICSPKSTGSTGKVPQQHFNAFVVPWVLIIAQ